jgi:hypothetical protein
MVGDILQCMINPAVATDLTRLGSAIRRQTLKSVGTEFGEALYECRHARSGHCILRLLHGSVPGSGGEMAVGCTSSSTPARVWESRTVPH